jgi:adenylate cyclase, class 1
VGFGTRGICPPPQEPVLSLHEMRATEGTSAWLLYAGLVKPAETTFRKPLKRTGSALEMLVWAQQNRLCDQATAWHVFAPGSALGVAEIRRLAETLDGALADGAADTALARRPRITQLLLFANVGIDPFAASLEQGNVLTTNRTDPFQFGGRRINLLRSLDLVFATSWGETYTFHYEGSTALPEALAECLRWPPFDGSEEALPMCTVRCFNSDYALQIAERVGRCFTSASRHFARHAADAPQFVLELDERVQQLCLSDGKPRVAEWTGQAQLQKALGAADGDRFRHVRFDHGCLRSGILPRLYAHNRPGRVQIFAQPRDDGRAEVYILDERGLLLVQRQECRRTADLLHHYRRFLASALARCAGAEDLALDTLEIGGSALEPTFIPHAGEPAYAVPYLSLQVFADTDAHGQGQFTIHADEREFSTWEHGGSLFVQVAEYVLARRRDDTPYPIYITDLDLSTRYRQQLGIATLRPYDLLNYKKRIEGQLTRALTREVVTPLPLAG